MRKESPHDILEYEELLKSMPAEEVKEKFEPIPDGDVDDVKKMNRHQRRAWLAKKRKK
jgi:hypothetical protein